jgi:hypothetical protein
MTIRNRIYESPYSVKNRREVGKRYEIAKGKLRLQNALALEGVS